MTYGRGRVYRVNFLTPLTLDELPYSPHGRAHTLAGRVKVFRRHHDRRMAQDLRDRHEVRAELEGPAGEGMAEVMEAEARDPGSLSSGSSRARNGMKGVLHALICVPVSTFWKTYSPR